jgi:hypothetical protein
MLATRESSAQRLALHLHLAISLLSAYEGAHRGPLTGVVDEDAGFGGGVPELLRSSLSLLLCQPKSEAAHLVIIDELNPSLFERCLNFEQS